jgi:hypothetical protein
MVRWAWTILAIIASCGSTLATDVPEDQKVFTEVIDRFVRAYAEAQNDMAKGATRQQRAKAICADPSRVAEWRDRLMAD